jgi:hypothetical protein
MGDDAAKIGRTEALFRDVNERIAEGAASFGLGTTEFLCECADPTCTERLSVDLDEYERVRTSATHFLLAPGHELAPQVERVVRHRGRYQVVRKVHDVVVAVVRRLDPRAEPA